MKFQLTFSIWSKSPTSKRRSIYPEEEGNKSINLADGGGEVSSDKSTSEWWWFKKDPDAAAVPHFR